MGVAPQRSVGRSCCRIRASNEIDPLKQGWEEGAQQKNSFVGTFDQQIFPGVTFFFTGFYTNRRVEEVLPREYSQGVTAELATLTVPTNNPYYPTGAPAGLQVSYDFAHEVPPMIPAYELSDRYSFGFNLDLPFGWSGQIYNSRSYETAQYELHYVNTNSMNIALGNTVSGADALGVPVNNVTKPASIPYLNVFCDPTAFQCNSPTTLAYIQGSAYWDSIIRSRKKARASTARFQSISLPGRSRWPSAALTNPTMW